MKIACISASQVPSLTANSIQMMKACHALAALGHTVRLWVPAGPTTPREQYAAGKQVIPGKALLPWEELAAHYGLQTPFEIRWLPTNPRLKRYDFAISAVQAARAWGAELAYIWPFQAAALALSLRVPTVLEVHGEPEGRLGPIVFRLILDMPWRKRFLIITRALASKIERAFDRPFAECELAIAPNGVDLDQYRNLPLPAAARSQLGLPQAFTAGYTGHLYPGRGMDLLVELAQRFPQVSFLWVGGQPEDVERWRSRLEQAHVSNVTLTGFVENTRVPLYQAAADVLLMPYERQIAGSSGGNSAEYCSPMKMFEYMACGRAILSSDLPVIGEVLNSANAVLCPPEDVSAWANALERIQTDPALAENLATQAREDVQAYTWEARARKALEGFCK